MSSRQDIRLRTDPPILGEGQRLVGRSGDGRSGVIVPGEVAVVAALAFALALVAFAPVSCDLGWQSFLAHRVLGGDRIYVDIAASDMHPPLYTAIVMIAEWLAETARVRVWIVAYALTTAAAVASVIATYRLAFRSPALLASLGLAAVAMAGGYYAGGEQLTVIAVLPYLASAAGAAEGRRVKTPWAVSIGLAAGLGLALKPQFALIWLVVEGYLGRRLGWRSFLRVESRTILVTWSAYLVAAVALTPEFFPIALWAADLYRAFLPAPVAFLLLNWTSWLVLAAATVVRLTQPIGIARHLSRLAVLAAACGWLIAVSQGKGWPTHWLLPQAFAILAIGAATPPRIRSSAGVALAATGLAAMLFLESVERARTAPYWPVTKAALEVAPRGPVLLLAGRLDFAFPAFADRHAQWSSPYSSFWMGPGLARSGSGYAYRRPEDWGPLERELRDGLWRGIKRYPPRVVILSKMGGDFDYRRFFEADPRVRALLSQFEIAKETPRAYVLKRRSSKG